MELHIKGSITDFVGESKNLKTFYNSLMKLVHRQIILSLSRFLLEEEKEERERGEAIVGYSTFKVLYKFSIENGARILLLVYPVEYNDMLYYRWNCQYNIYYFYSVGNSIIDIIFFFNNFIVIC